MLGFARVLCNVNIMNTIIPRVFASSLLLAECCRSLRRKAQIYLNTLRWLVGIDANTCTQYTGITLQRYLDSQTYLCWSKLIYYRQRKKDTNQIQEGKCSEKISRQATTQSRNLKHTLNSVKHFNQAPNSAAAKHFCRRQLLQEKNVKWITKQFSDIQNE